MDIIFRNVPVGDMTLAVRAVRWLSERPTANDALLSYGEGPAEKLFYARRAKNSIIVRPA